MSTPIQTGDIVRLGRAASVQFDGDRALTLRIMKIDEKPTYHGWVWLSGYALDERGEAIEKREVYVQSAGVRRLEARPPGQRRRP